MRHWARSHLTYANVMVTILAFIALGGGAYAALHLPRNSVRSRNIKNGQVKRADLAKGAVTGSKVRTNALGGTQVLESSLDSSVLQSRVGGGCASNQAISQIAQNGHVACESSIPGPPTGVAGGDLSGTYPGPSITDGAVGPGKLGTFPAAHVHDVDMCNASLLVPNATETTVGWDVEDFDTGGDQFGIHINFCGQGAFLTKLIAPRDGLYEVSAGLIWSSSSAGSRQLILKRNGSDNLAAQQAAPSPGNDATIQNVSALTRLQANDYVEAVAWQDSGGNLAIFAPSDARNFFAMNWVGP